MSDSELFGSNTRPQSTNRPAFRITLRDVDGFEGFDSRQFCLALNSTFPIGRASKNTTKADLMPASSNAYVDSPVISREHAVLSALAESGVPHVYIMDKGSMHGTIVNGERLAAHLPRQLSTGDKLQFGIDVNRNEGTPPNALCPLSASSDTTDLPPSEFFVARKYEFEAHLNGPQAPFSKGFTVPDSDEEEVDGRSTRRGSQFNPLTIDDSDSDSEASGDERVGTTMFGQSFIVDADGDDDEPPAVTDIHLLKETYPQSITLVEQDHSENEGSGYYSSDVQDDDLDEMNSQASIMGDSITGYDSDLGLPEVELQPEPAQSRPSLESQVPVHTGFSSQNLFQSSTFDPLQHVFTNSFPPPLPPRPSAAQPERSELPSDDRLSYIYSNDGLYHPVPVAPYVPRADMYIMNDSANMAPSTERLQTPPPMMPSDTTTTATPPPSRRTKVSIGEIVEDQPPTPTSLNSMKRKADVLDDSEIPAASSPEVSSSVSATEPVERSEVPIVVLADNITAQTAAIIARRPKKQPKSILGRLQTTAKVLGIGAAGAAGALAVLSALPDAFFV